MSYKAPVLLMIFNRYNTAANVFAMIRQYQPPTLYISADGPRADYPDDDAACAAARKVVDLIDWPCALHVNFLQSNMGVKDGCIGALNWFFGQEEEGIILEDDCVPNLSFFTFANEMLTKYRNDSRIMHIAGTNLQFGKHRGEPRASYYFSNISAVWGWAGWRRTWQRYDPELTLYKQFETEHLLRHVLRDDATAKWGEEMCRMIINGTLISWDFQLSFAILINNGLNITPNKNLVSNIGFGQDASHTFDEHAIHANLETEALEELIHPKFFLADKDADIFQLGLSRPAPAAAPLKRRLANFVSRLLHH